ncbi:MAG: hypothetical protein M1820_007653 [Bogoriella megaspora]|nr:MAG: hypothetical protein M1820_007653 [Bogoriella megaspora]
MPAPPQSRSAIGSQRNRTKTTSSAFDPLAAQTSNARIRRPPRNRSLTTPSRLLWEQQLQHVVSEGSAPPVASTENAALNDFSWDPSLAVTQGQSLENQPAPHQPWPLSETPQASGVDLPTYSVDTASSIYQGSHTTNQNLGFDDQINTEDMSSLGFVIPQQQQQYGGLEYGSNFERSSYNMQPHPYARSPSASHAQSPPANYPSSFALSPAMLGNHSHPPSGPNGQRVQDRVSPRMETPAYRSTSLGASNSYGVQQSPAPSVARGLTYPAVSGEVPTSGAPARSSGLAPHYMPGSTPSVGAYESHYTRSPPPYGAGGYAPGNQEPQPSGMPYLPSLSQGFQPSYVTTAVGDTTAGGPTSSQGPVRVINSRPKPQCWEHGCNGRQFSTFSNLLRHQREKSGTAAKSYCPKCGAEFTRTTARNGHLAHDKCSKQRKGSEGGS